MSLISAQGLQKFYAATPVLLDINFTLARGERVGLIGRNGTGKTTLLRLLAGLEEADSGRVTLANGVTIGYLTQDVQLPLEDSVWRAVSAGLGPVMAIERRLRQLEQQMGKADVLADDERLQRVMREYERANAEFERLDGYNCEVKIRTTLNGLGLTEEFWQQPVGRLSGGQRTRAALAHLLLLSPEVLLLDEPTNHLDMEAIAWLEGHLLGYGGALLAVSHDREFLDKVANKIWDLEQNTLTAYVGNYSAYLGQKADWARRQELLHREQQAEREHLQRLIGKFKYGTRATMAKSWEKRLEKLQPVQRQRRQRRMKLSAETRRRSGNDVLTIKQLAKSFPNKPLFDGFSAEVKMGDRVALIGANGAGKTTLLRVLLGELPADAGKFRWGASIDFGYFSQDLRLPDDEITVLDCLLQDAKLQPAEGRSWLARFLFTGESVFQLVGTLSGGERNRLILAKLLLSKANVLILDEPTNHLDIPARESLEQVLSEYPGTLFIVSHDRFFLKRVATRVWYLQAGRIRDFTDGYPAFEEALQPQQQEEPAKPQKQSVSKPRPAASKPKLAGPTLQQLEESIGKLELEHEALTERLADPKTYQDGAGAETVARFREVEQELATLYAEWEQLAGAEAIP
jgi:ATP-binding cassette subfamily F protein 3